MISLLRSARCLLRFKVPVCTDSCHQIALLIPCTCCGGGFTQCCRYAFKKFRITYNRTAESNVVRQGVHIAVLKYYPWTIFNQCLYPFNVVDNFYGWCSDIRGPFYGSMEKPTNFPVIIFLYVK